MTGCSQPVCQRKFLGIGTTGVAQPPWRTQLGLECPLRASAEPCSRRRILVVPRQPQTLAAQHLGLACVSIDEKLETGAPALMHRQGDDLPLKLERRPLQRRGQLRRQHAGRQQARIGNAQGRHTERPQPPTPHKDQQPPCNQQQRQHPRRGQFRQEQASRHARQKRSGAARAKQRECRRRAEPGAQLQVGSDVSGHAASIGGQRRDVAQSAPQWGVRVFLMRRAHQAGATGLRAIPAPDPAGAPIDDRG